MKREGLLRHPFVARFVTGAARRAFPEGFREASKSLRRKKMPGAGFEPARAEAPGILSATDIHYHRQPSPTTTRQTRTIARLSVI